MGFSIESSFSLLDGLDGGDGCGFCFLDILLVDIYCFRLRPRSRKCPKELRVQLMLKRRFQVLYQAALGSL